MAISAAINQTRLLISGVFSGIGGSRGGDYISGYRGGIGAGLRTTHYRARTHRTHTRTRTATRHCARTRIRYENVNERQIRRLDISRQHTAGNKTQAYSPFFFTACLSSAGSTHTKHAPCWEDQTSSAGGA